MRRLKLQTAPLREEFTHCHEITLRIPVLQDMRNQFEGNFSTMEDEDNTSLTEYQIGSETSDRSVEELREIVLSLRHEIARLETEIEKRAIHLSTAAKLFKS